MHTAKLLHMSSGVQEDRFHKWIETISGEIVMINNKGWRCKCLFLPVHYQQQLDSYSASCMHNSYFHTRRDMIIRYLCSWQIPALFSQPSRLGSTAVEYLCVLVTKLVWNATNMGKEISNHWEIWQMYTNHFVCNINCFCEEWIQKTISRFCKFWCFHNNVWVFLYFLNLLCLKKKEMHPFRTYRTSDPVM